MRDLYTTKGVPRPDLCIVVLPDGGDEIYAAVKQYVHARRPSASR